MACRYYLNQFGEVANAAHCYAAHGAARLGSARHGGQWPIIITLLRTEARLCVAVRGRPGRVERGRQWRD